MMVVVKIKAVCGIGSLKEPAPMAPTLKCGLPGRLVIGEYDEKRK